MASKLLAFVLVLSNRSEWITPQVTNCIQNITDLYFKQPSLLNLNINADMEYKHQSYKTVYFSTGDVPAKHHKFDTVLLSSNLTSWYPSELRGKVLLITQTLDNVHILWTKLRLLNLAVLLIKEKELDVYSWFPYKKQFCHDEPPLLHIDTWRNGSFDKGTNLFPDKIPKSFKGCPLVTTMSVCEPFAMRNSDGGLYGMEPEIFKIMFESLNIAQVNFTLPPRPSWYYIYKLSDGTYSGMYQLLLERTIDVAGGCVSINHEKSLLSENLPSHLSDHLMWLFPGPVPASNAYGFANCLREEIWLATGVSFIGVGLFLIFGYPSPQYSHRFVWLLAHFLGLPYTEHFGTLHKVFEIFLELMILILTSLYRSSLLMNLFGTPKEIIKNPEEGIAKSLRTLLRPSHPMYSDTNSPVWKYILKPEHHKVVVWFPYEEIINRTSMALGFKYGDQSQFRVGHPDLPYKKVVTMVNANYPAYDMALLLPLNHPLTAIFRSCMARIIESGFPNFHVDLVLDSLPGKTKAKDDTNKPLAIHHLLTVFYLHFGLLAIIVIVFVGEMLVARWSDQKLKKKHNVNVSYGGRIVHNKVVIRNERVFSLSQKVSRKRANFMFN